MVNFTVRDALVAAPPSPEAAAQFVAYLDSIDRRAEYRLAAELERAWTITWCDLLRQRPSPLLEAAEGWSTGDPLDVWAVRHYASWPGRPFLNMGETHYLRGMSGYLNALDVPPGRAGEAYEAIDAAVARMPTGSLWWLMSGDVLGNLPRHRDKSATELALMQVAVALEVQRARDGVYPETLAELDALPRFTVPADPFTGAPLHYRRTARGFLLWSVGPDLDDDGGEGMWADLGGRPSRRHWPDADVAWEVAR